MTDPVAESMQPMMDTLYARWLEQDIDAGLVDPDMFYERQRDREAYEQQLAHDESRAEELRHRPEEPPEPEPDDACPECDGLGIVPDLGDYDSAHPCPTCRPNPAPWGREPEGNPKSAPLPDTSELEYEEMLAEMGIEPHEYEEHQ